MMTNEERESSYQRYKQWQVNKIRYRNESIAYALMFGVGLLFILSNWEGFLVAVGIGFVAVAICLWGRIYSKWSKKNKALTDIKTMAEEFGAKDIEIDVSEGKISFTADSDILNDKVAEIEKSLIDNDVKSQITRTKHSDVESKIMSSDENSNDKLKSTSVGYVNKNNQRNNGKTNQIGTDNQQFFYQMECLNCGHTYLANGTDIWQRKCPSCQGGKP